MSIRTVLMTTLVLVALVALPGHAAGAEDFSGTWATQVVLPITWENIAVPRLAGEVRLIGRVERRKVGEGAYLDQFFPCGLTFPAFDTARSRTYYTPNHGIMIPDSLFDERFFPPSPPYRFDANAADSYAFTGQTVGLVVGAELDDWISSPWLTRDFLQTVDADLDGRPGFTVLPENRWGKTPIGVNIFGTWSARSIWAAMRMRFNMKLQARSTSFMDGQASSIGEVVEKTILGGEKVDQTGTRHAPFSPSDSNLLQELFNLRTDPTRPGTVRMRKITEPMSCAEIRVLQF